MTNGRIIGKNGYIIVTNCKCGYSSLTTMKDSVKIKKINNNDDIIFVYRNVYIRNISVFLHWCVRKINIGSWLLDYIRNIISDSMYLQFKKLIIDNMLIESYKIFLNILPKIYMLDKHLHPQNKILKDNNITHIKYFINLDNKNDLLFLEKLINYELPKYNESDKSQKNILLNFIHTNDNLKKKITNIYKTDIDFLKSNIKNDIHI